MDFFDWLCAQVPTHPPNHECPDAQCVICGIRDCPHGHPLHNCRNGCPACDSPDVMTQDAIENPSND